MTAKKGLGKGLGALINETGRAVETRGDASSGVLEIDINNIEPNRNQPRKRFDDAALRELADSVSEHGILQPLLVNKEDGGRYSIVAGERRWRAARLAGLTHVPVIIKDYSEPETLQAALIENLQREDINIAEAALTYKRLIDEFFFRQEDIAAKIGKSRSLVAFSLSLLQLDPRVLEMLLENSISPSIAKILLQIEDGDTQLKAAEKITQDGMTASKAESYVKSLMSQTADNEQEHKKTPNPAMYAHLERDLNIIFGTRVSIKNGKNKGKIEIEYYSPEDLDRLIGLCKDLPSARAGQGD